MKTLVKITAICALVLISFTANAQMKVGAGLGLVMPMGPKVYTDAYGMGFGAVAQGKYMLNDNMAIGLGLGYLMQSGKDVSELKFNMIPIVANFTYYFATEGFKPYVGADLGFYMWSTKFDGTKVADGSDLGFAPTVGFEYGLSDKLSLDVNAKYNYIMTEGDATTSLGINVGVLMSLGE